MPFYNYEYADGHNNSAGAVNIETIVPNAPKATPVPLGSVTRYTGGGYRRTDGAIWVEWRFQGIWQTDLDTLITTIWTDWDTENVEVTIKTRKRDDTYAYYNAVAHLPRAGEEYTKLLGGLRRDVVVRFRIIGTAT